MPIMIPIEIVLISWKFEACNFKFPIHVWIEVMWSFRQGTKYSYHKQSLKNYPLNMCIESGLEIDIIDLRRENSLKFR